MENAKLICVNCGCKANKLYEKYGKDVIKLTNCDQCGKLVDKYVEYDVVLTYIDLLLQYLSAYRHIFINVNYSSFWRIIVVFTMFSSYNKWTYERSFLQLDPKLVYELEWQFYKSLVEAAVEIVAYSLTLLFISSIFGYEILFWKRYLSISMCGFYGNSLMVFSIIWNLHDKLPFVLVIQLFLFISHVQIQRVLCPDRGYFLSLFAVLVGMASQYLCGQFAKNLIRHMT